MINWTQPVETSEDPPRPVRVLCTDAPAPCHVIALVGRDILRLPLYATHIPGSSIPLRNVTPKLMEEDEGFTLRKQTVATQTAESDRDYWKAKAEETFALLKSRNDAYDLVLRDAEHWMREAKYCERRVVKAQADALEDHDRTKPVVDAAIALAEHDGCVIGLTSGLNKLFNEVRIYRGGASDEL